MEKLHNIEVENTEINYDSMVKRLLEAIVKRLEGSDDPRKKYDYLAKLDKDTIKTLSVLSDSQLDSVAECCWLADTFPSMQPLKDFALELAAFSPSKAGKRAEQITATMISQETHVVPTTMISQPAPKKDKEKKDKGDEK